MKKRLSVLLKTNWDRFLLGLMILSYILVLGTLSILRHNAFASGFDLGNMDQTLWNTLHGRFFSFTHAQGQNISRFSTHADLILVLLVPFYLIWEDVRMLLLLQTIFLALGAIPVYLLAEKVLKNKFIAILVSALYLINPGMQWTNIYDFHPVSLAIPFLISALYFIYIKKLGWYWIFIILSLITKEQISLSTALLGFFIFFILKEKKVGMLTVFISLFWFWLTVFKIIPYFNISGEHWALSWYRSTDVNAKTTDIIKGMINRLFFTPEVTSYYILLLRPFTFLPLIGLPWLILSFPELIVNVLSTNAQMLSFFLHYDSGVTGWLVIALIFGLHNIHLILKKIKPVSRFKNRILVIITVAIFLYGVRVNYQYSPLPTTPSCWCIMYRVTEEDRKFEKLLQQIPQSASITASPEIRPHVTHRENSYTLPMATGSADFIALIDQNRLVGNYEPKEFELELRDQLKTSENYHLVKQIGHFYLYKKNSYRWRFNH